MRDWMYRVAVNALSAVGLGLAMLSEVFIGAATAVMRHGFPDAAREHDRRAEWRRKVAGNA